MENNDMMMRMLFEDVTMARFCPPEKVISKLSSLPKELDPFHEFEDEELDLLQAMDFMTDSLRKWHKAGRAESRFGKEYIRISRLIEKAVTILGRGLMTLHVKGEDLTKAPTK